MTSAISSAVHVTSWLSRQGGGIPPVVWALAGAMRQQGVNTSVVGLHDEWVTADCGNCSVPFKTGEVTGPASYGFSAEMARQLHGFAQPAGIVHSHGLWMYPGAAARRSAVKTKGSLVISPHGMLEPWALNHARFKKQLAGWLFENKNLRMANCLHALCAAEAEHFRQIGLTNPIAIIPNGVELNQSLPKSDRDELTERFPQLKGRRRALFLSRMHPKKGLDNLLRAWKNLGAGFDDWSLMIAGNGHTAYEEQLRSLVREFSLEQKVFFLGPLYGADKARAFAAADFFVLPSFSEGFSMAILEAAAAGLPVLLTPECNFHELVTAKAGIEVATNPQSIETGLKHIMLLSDEQRIEMGLQGSKLVARAYTWPVIATQMLEVYEWLAGGGPVPKCVQVI